MSHIDTKGFIDAMNEIVKKMTSECDCFICKSERENSEKSEKRESNKTISITLNIDKDLHESILVLLHQLNVNVTIDKFYTDAATLFKKELEVRRKKTSQSDMEELRKIFKLMMDNISD